jgi:hypothetical protein
MTTKGGLIYVYPHEDIQQRLEIDDFCQDAIQTNLFLLALADLQNNDVNLKTSWLSYFHIAGKL